jgi:CxxC-x17-CxxC domain-containing protein
MADFKRSGGFGGNKHGGGFNKGGRPSFGRDGGFKRQGGRDDRPRAEMFTAVCDECHKTCEVPFRPTGEKPVYCRECFAGKREYSGNDFQRRDSAPREFHKKEFTPSFSSAKPQGEDRRIDELKRQLDVISSKVDQLLQMAERANPAKAAVITTPQATKVTLVKTAVVVPQVARKFENSLDLELSPIKAVVPKAAAKKPAKPVAATTKKKPAKKKK